MAKRLCFALAIAVALAAGLNAGGGAIVINDKGCGMLDGDGGFVFADRDHAVITPSPNGNGMLSCKVKGVPNSTGKAVIWNFENRGSLVQCGTPAGPTDNWQETISASGNATLTCLVK